MMATATTDSTFNLRHRLVGAFILIALAVFVLPMVLRGASDGEKTVTVDIATPSEKRQPKEFTSRVTAVGEGAAKVVQETGANGSKVVSFEGAKAPEQAPLPTAPPTASQSAPQDATSTTPSAPAVVVVPAPKNTPQPESTAAPLSVQVEPQPLKPGEVVIASTAPAVETQPAPIPVVKVAPPTPATNPAPKPKAKTGNVPDSSLNVTTDRGWVVRVGTFGQPSNARTMARRLQSKGFEPRSTKEKTKEGLTMTRVWVGPFPERVTAGRVLEKILKQTGEKGFISPFP